MKRRFLWLGAFLIVVFAMFAQEPSAPPGSSDFDVIIKNGTVYDGTGAEPKSTAVAPARLIPKIMTSILPEAGPLRGKTLVTAGP